jgi:NADH:ubiquinone oxidoreductase subunit H
MLGPNCTTATYKANIQTHALEKVQTNYEKFKRKASMQRRKGPNVVGFMGLLQPL